MSTDLTRLLAKLSRADIENLLAAKDEVEGLETRRAELAKELEEWTQPGYALRTAQETVPDTNLMYQPDDISADTQGAWLVIKKIEIDT